MCTKPFSQTKNKGKVFLVAKSSGPLLARMPLKLHSEPPLHYTKQQASQQYEFLFCVEIPWPLLRLWVDSLDSKPVELSYIDLLNASAVDGLFTIRRGCLRIEELLRKKASTCTVRQAYRKTQGSKRQQPDTNVYKLSVRRMETESLETLKAEVEKCQKDLGEWKKKYADLENEKQNLYNEMKNESNKL